MRLCKIGVLTVVGILGAVPAWCGDALDEVTRQQAGTARRFSTGLFDPESNIDYFKLAPGACRTLTELQGPGEIRHIWFTVAHDRRYPRSLVLRIYWDDAATPSVESPIGDFFAAGNGMKADVHTLPLEVTSYGRSLNSYWHMPFRKKARVELWNQSPHRLTVYCQIDWMQLPSLPENTLYFHARYHQEFPVKPFSPYTIFEGRGEGQYVGTVLSTQNSLGSWYGESDDRYYIDGEETPSLVGTGTEDFFTDAWNMRLFTNLNAGVTICEPNGVDSRKTAYRWHLQAPVVFHKSLKVEIERRSFAELTDPVTGKRTVYDFVYRPDFFSSVAFWYQKGVARPFCALPPVEERLNPEIWIEVKDLAGKLACSEGLRPAVRTNRTCFEKKMFFLENDKPGAWLDLPVEIKEEGQYSISCFQLLFPEYGTWKVTLRGPETSAVLDPALDFYDSYNCLKENWPESYVYGTVNEAKLGVLRLKPGAYTMRFECVGCNPLSRVKKTGKPGYSLALDAVSLRKLPWDHMDRWMADYLAQEKILKARHERDAQQTVLQLSEAVARFAKDTGAYPKTLDDLLAPPSLSGGGKSKTAYFPGPRIPLDPWGQPYLYVHPGKHHPQGADIYSVRGNSRDPRGWIGNWKATAYLKALRQKMAEGLGRLHDSPERLRTADRPIVCGVDMESPQVIQERERNPAGERHRDRLQRFRARMEELSGLPCLVVHYTQIARSDFDNPSIRAILIMGQAGESCEPLLREVVAVIRDTDKPMIGLCRGHQLIAETFGAPVEKMRRLKPGEKDPDPKYKPGYFKESGFLPVEVKRPDPLFDGCGVPPVFKESHCAEIKQLPPGFLRLAGSPECRFESIRLEHPRRILYGVQFHPESYDEQHLDGKTLLANFFRIAGLGPKPSGKKK
jgi:GMP synthase-like glutamine amidotransferase